MTDSPEPKKENKGDKPESGNTGLSSDALAAQLLAEARQGKKPGLGTAGTLTVSDTLLTAGTSFTPQLIRTGNTGLDAVANFGQGAARNVGQMLKGTMHAVANPLDTVHGLGNLGKAVVDNPSIVTTSAKDFGAKLVSGDVAQAADAWGSLTAFASVTGVGLRGAFGHGERTAVQGAKNLEQAAARTEGLVTSTESRLASAGTLKPGEVPRIPTNMRPGTWGQAAENGVGPAPRLSNLGEVAPVAPKPTLNLADDAASLTRPKLDLLPDNVPGQRPRLDIPDTVPAGQTRPVKVDTPDTVQTGQTRPVLDTPETVPAGQTRPVLDAPETVPAGQGRPVKVDTPETVPAGQTRPVADAPDTVPAGQTRPVKVDTPDTVPAGQNRPAAVDTPESVPAGQNRPAAVDTPEPVPAGQNRPTAVDTPESVPAGQNRPAAVDTPESVPSGQNRPAAVDTPESVPAGQNRPAVVDTPESVPAGQNRPAAVDAPDSVPPPKPNSLVETPEPLPPGQNRPAVVDTPENIAGSKTRPANVDAPDSVPPGQNRTTAVDTPESVPQGGTRPAVDVPEQQLQPVKPQRVDTPDNVPAVKPNAFTDTPEPVPGNQVRPRADVPDEVAVKPRTLTDTPEPVPAPRPGFDNPADDIRPRPNSDGPGARVNKDEFVAPAKPNADVPENLTVRPTPPEPAPPVKPNTPEVAPGPRQNLVPDEAPVIRPRTEPTPEVQPPVRPRVEPTPEVQPAVRPRVEPTPEVQPPVRPRVEPNSQPEINVNPRTVVPDSPVTPRQTVTPALDKLDSVPALRNTTSDVRAQLQAIEQNPSIANYDKLGESLRRLQQEAKAAVSASELKVLAQESKATLEVARQTMLTNAIRDTADNINSIVARAQQSLGSVPGGLSGEAAEIVARIRAQAQSLLGAETQKAQFVALNQLKQETAQLQGILRQAGVAEAEVQRLLATAALEKSHLALVEANTLARTGGTLGGQIKDFLNHNPYVRGVELTIGALQVGRIVDELATAVPAKNPENSGAPPVQNTEKEDKTAPGTKPEELKPPVKEFGDDNHIPHPAVDQNPGPQKVEGGEGVSRNSATGAVFQKEEKEDDDYTSTIHRQNRDRISGVDLDFVYYPRAFVPGVVDDAASQTVNPFRPQFKTTSGEQQEKTAHLQFDWRKTRLHTDGTASESPLLANPMGFKPSRISAVRGLSGGGSSSNDLNNPAANLIARNYAFAVGPAAKPGPKQVGPGKEDSEKTNPDRSTGGGAAVVSQNPGTATVVAGAPVAPNQDPKAAAPTQDEK